VNPALQGYLAAVEDALSVTGGLAEAGAELAAVAELVDNSNQLTLAVNDGSVPVPARRSLLDHLLDGKVRPEVRSIVHQAVTVVPAGELTASFHWLAYRMIHDAEDGSATESAPEEVLGRMGSRNRVAGYAAAVFEGLTIQQLEEIEDELFRFARTVESNRRLRNALGDRDLPVTVRQGLIAKLLGDQVLPATLRLTAYAVRGGRARDFVPTLDTLVDGAAQARGWRVARVMSASEVADSQRQSLGDALAQLTGNPVDLQVTIDPQLLGGVVVHVGDLLVDSSTRHRLNQLKEHLLVSEETYQTQRAPRREATDG
jgi:F-type H+-transporting ATPase subunit delta